jgi:ribonuclease R
LKYQKNKNWSIEDKILDVIRSKKSKVWLAAEIATNFPRNTFREIVSVCEKLVKDGKIIKSATHKYKYKTSENLLQGTLDFNQRGVAYLMCEGVEDDLKMSGKETADAFHGDEVLVEVIGSRRSRKVKPKVIQVLKRARSRFIGTIQGNGKHFFFIPDDPKIHTDFFIGSEGLNGAKNLDKVAIELIHWKDLGQNPVGRVVENFGKSGSNTAEMHAIVAEFGFETRFSEEVEAAAAALSDKITDKDLAEREDFRDILTFTIDPEDAKDFDDAISFRILENGNYEVGVHIADVSHYVTPNDVIDQEAVKRSTSVYLVDRTIPMLPERLSNELCSLRPNEDSFCFSAIFEMNKNTDVVKHRFAKTIIHSAYRFSYEQAQDVLDGKADTLKDELQTLNKLAHKLRTKRYNNGSINFETTEYKFKLDAEGKPLAVIPKERKDCHKLIEDYMLLANKYVAQFLYKTCNQAPAPYRVHEEPSLEKLSEFAETAAVFGYKIDVQNIEQLPFIINKLVEEVQGTDIGNILQPLAIRSMEKAYYTTKKTYHFGLAFDYYAHFTSPIRRYPDLITHRMLYDYLTKNKSFDYSKNEDLAKHCSNQEQKAVNAERASIKYKQVEFLSNFKGEEFEGTITGLTDWGIFVELIENKCEGMVRISDMQGDKYIFIPEKKKVVGSRTKKSYVLGQKLWIKVKDTNLLKRNIDLTIIE